MSDRTERASHPHLSGGGTPRRRAGDVLHFQILDAIEDYSREHGRPPTMREIASKVGIKSSGHVAHHVDNLEREGWLSREAGISRGLMSTRPAGLRLLGFIAAGEPLELFNAGESEPLELGELTLISTPSSVGKGVYALRVRGSSMIEDGILDGDYVLIAPGSTDVNGKIAVAIQNSANGGSGAATLKRVFFQPDGVRLQPANATFAARFIAAEEWDREWRVQGMVVAVCRQYALR